MIEFKDVARAVWEAQESDQPVALASIINIRGSSPRHNGARMLVWPDGRIVGTIGGGTMEYRVIEDARAAIQDQQEQLHNYVFDASGRPGSVGLCGGSVDVHIAVDLAEFADVSRKVHEALERGERVVLATLVTEGKLPPKRAHTQMVVWPDGSSYAGFDDAEREAEVIELAQKALAKRTAGLVRIRYENGQARLSPIEVHLDILEPSETLLILGAGHVAQPLAALGSALGFRVCVVDDRPEWANAERFPTADEIAVIDYEPVHEILAPIPFPMTPDTYLVITTWGYDLPVMEQALRQNPGYIGLVASPTKARVLFKRLRQAGFADDEIQRILAPVGLDIGAESPAEIAVAVLGEILAKTRGKTGRPLREVRGAIIDTLFASPTGDKANQGVGQPSG